MARVFKVRSVGPTGEVWGSEELEDPADAIEAAGDLLDEALAQDVSNNARIDIVIEDR